MNSNWSSFSEKSKSNVNSVNFESADALTGLTIDDDSLNPSELFSRDYLKKLSDSNGDSNNFLQKYIDPFSDRDQEASVESLLNKIRSSDNDYIHSHHHDTRQSGASKLKDTTNIRRNGLATCTGKPDNKCQFHNKINQTVIDLSEEQDDDILKLFDRSRLWPSPDLLQDYIIQDNDLDNFINEDEIDEAKEIVEKRKSKEPCLSVLDDQHRDTPIDEHDLDSSSSEITSKQLLDVPADEDSRSLPDVRNDLLMSDDSDSPDSRETFKKKLSADVSSLRDVYKVEKLLAKRLRKGRWEYLVKYENLDDDQTCWESEKTLDEKMVEEFNKRYGDKLVLKGLDKRTYAKYFDKRIDESHPKDAPHKERVELKELIEHSLANPLCNVYNNVGPERIVGVYQYSGRYYFLVKWEKLTKADLFECAKFQERWPDIVRDYYQSKIMFCELQENRQSAEISAKRRVNLHQQPK